MLKYLLPWMRDLLVENDEETMLGGYRKRDMMQIIRELRIIKDRKSPDNFPVLPSASMIFAVTRRNNYGASTGCCTPPIRGGRKYSNAAR